MSLNPDIDFSKGISRVMHKSFIIRLTKLIKEKIPVIVTQPIGEPPKGYQFLDVYPYTLNLTVQGPEDVLKHLKNKGAKLTFNLNEISKETLDSLVPSSSSVLGSEIVISSLMVGNLSRSPFFPMPLLRSMIPRQKS